MGQGNAFRNFGSCTTGELSVEKLDEKTAKGMEGVEFALYTESDGTYYPVKYTKSDETISYATYGNSVSDNYVTMTMDSDGILCRIHRKLG